MAVDDPGPAPPGPDGVAEPDADTAAVPVNGDADDAGLDEARAYADPHGPGYSDAALVVGNTWSRYVHVGALLLAGGADVGAFYQVVARVLDASDLLIILVVLGFSGVVIYLGHVVGVLLRNWRARVRSTSPIAVVVCLVVLALLGAVAYLVRLNVPTSSKAPPTTYSAGGAPAAAAATAGHAQYAALVFLGLYVATVTVAAMGAYLTHNPLQEGYLAAVRAYRRWAATAASAHAAFIVEEHRAHGEQAGRDASSKIAEAQRHRILALAEELKHTGRLRMLAAARDPAVTDAWTRDDARPYDFRRYGPHTNGSDHAEGN